MKKNNPLKVGITQKHLSPSLGELGDDLLGPCPPTEGGPVDPAFSLAILYAQQTAYFTDY